jgi:hypothetical protein
MLVQGRVAALINGLEWVCRQQNGDGGWSPTVPAGASDAEATGHVVFVLSQILGIGFEAVERAMLWTEAEFITVGGGNIGYWPQHLLRGSPNQSAGLLCCYNLLRGEELGRNLKRIDRADLMRTAKDAVNRSLSKAKASRWLEGQGPFWEVHMASLIINLACFEGALRDVWKEHIEGIMSDVSKCVERIDGAGYAQILLGLLHFREPSKELVDLALDKLVGTCKRDGNRIYWEHIYRKRGGQFETVRWVLYSLEEAYRGGIGKRDLLGDVINGGTCWNLSEQAGEGYWRRDDKEVFGPNYCGYALLSLWKWIEIKGEVGREPLAMLLERMLRAEVSVSEYEEVQRKCRELRAGYENLQLQVRKCILYKVVTYLLLTALVLALVQVAGWRKVGAVVRSHGSELGIVAALLAIGGATVGMLSRLRKWLKKGG